MNISVVTRSAWQAESPLKVDPMSFPIRTVLDTDTRTQQCVSLEECCYRVKEVQVNDMFARKRHMDIRYSFLIGGDGEIYEGRGWGARPMIPVRYKSLGKRSLLIAFIGFFEDYSAIPKNMHDAWTALVEYGIQNNFIAKDFKREEIFLKPQNL